MKAPESQVFALHRVSDLIGSELRKDGEAMTDDREANGREQSTLHEVVADGSVETLRACVAERGDVEATDQLGRSPLHIAAMIGSLEKVQILLHAGAKPAPRDAYGRTPADMAARRGYREIVAELAAACQVRSIGR